MTWSAGQGGAALLEKDGLSFLLRHSRSQGDENMMLPWLSSALGPTPDYVAF